MKKYTTEPTKVHLSSVMETIMKNIGKIQNVRKNTGVYLKYNFTFQKDAGQQKEQVFVIYV